MPFDDLRSGFNPSPGEVPPPVGTDEPSTHQSFTPSPPRGSPRRRRTGILVGGAVVAVLLVLLGYYLFRTTTDDPMNTAEAFLRAYAAGDEAEVAELSCPGTDWRTWEFTDWVGTAPLELTDMSWTLAAGQWQGSAPAQNSLGVPATVTVSSPQSGSRTRSFTMSLQPYDSHWRVCVIR